MKFTRTSLLSLGLIAGLLTHAAAELATAKVITVEGNVRATRTVGVPQDLVVEPGTILEQGDQLVTSPLSSVILAFSNGSIMTLSQNSTLTLKELAQEPYGGDAEYEELEADPSQSTTVLNLEYGNIGGNVKKIREDSRFEIETILGTAAIRGTNVEVGILADLRSGLASLSILNKDGLVDLIAQISGVPAFSGGGVGIVQFNSGSEPSTTPVPPGATIVSQISINDPAIYEWVVSFARNIQQSSQRPNPPLPGQNPQGGDQGGTTPETDDSDDPSDISDDVIISPNEPGTMVGDSEEDE